MIGVFFLFRETALIEQVHSLESTNQQLSTEIVSLQNLAKPIVAMDVDDGTTEENASNREETDSGCDPRLAEGSK